MLDTRAQVLVTSVARLAATSSLQEIQEIVRTAARAIGEADGATFVLRDGTRCFYADEDAIAPLWKGQRFPLDRCVSGWVMRHREAVTIPDIYADDRVPQDAYRPTFVTSMAMVPIRREEPIGAIGNYWARPHAPAPGEIALLQALADSTSVAMENVRVWSELEERVADGTARLRGALDLNERVLGTIAHEVRNCLAASSMLLETVVRSDGDELPPRSRERIEYAQSTVGDGIRLLESQLTAARDRAGELEVQASTVDVAALLRRLAATYDVVRNNRDVQLVIEPPENLPQLSTDGHLLTQALRNLVSNALKFTTDGEVRVGVGRWGEDHLGFTVADTGVGMTAGDLERVFEEWQQTETKVAGAERGTGLGLPFVRRIATLLGGDLRATSQVGVGSVFTLTVALDG